MNLEDRHTELTYEWAEMLNSMRNINYNELEDPKFSGIVMWASAKKFQVDTILEQIPTEEGLNRLSVILEEMRPLLFWDVISLSAADNKDTNI